jgi:hypothetical protein
MAIGNCPRATASRQGIYPVTDARARPADPGRSRTRGGEWIVVRCQRAWPRFGAASIQGSAVRRLDLELWGSTQGLARSKLRRTAPLPCAPRGGQRTQSARLGSRRHGSHGLGVARNAQRSLYGITRVSSQPPPLIVHPLEHVPARRDRDVSRLDRGSLKNAHRERARYYPCLAGSVGDPAPSPVAEDHKTLRSNARPSCGTVVRHRRHVLVLCDDDVRGEGAKCTSHVIGRRKTRWVRVTRRVAGARGSRPQRVRTSSTSRRRRSTAVLLRREHRPCVPFERERKLETVSRYRFRHSCVTNSSPHDERYAG